MISNKMTQTRLKLTIFCSLFIAIVSFYCFYILYQNNDNTGAWTCLGLCVGSMISAVGLYVNFETKRASERPPSFTSARPPAPARPNPPEDFSDPQETPL